MSHADPPGLDRRFNTIIATLCATIAVRAAKQRALAPLIVLLWGRLRRLAARFERLATRAEAGHPPMPPSSRPSRPRPASRPPAGLGPALPQGFAWLVRLAPETAGYGSQLQALLDDPAMATLLKAAPQAGRLLRPLCRMLGVRPGPPLALPRRKRSPRPSRPKSAHVPQPVSPRQIGSFLLGPLGRASDPPARA